MRKLGKKAVENALTRVNQPRRDRFQLKKRLPKVGPDDAVKME